MKIKRCALIGLLALQIVAGGFARPYFTCGHGRLESVPNQAELVARLNLEVQAIACALLEADAMEGTRVSVFLSPGNSNGFETKFECDEPQFALLTAEESWRSMKVHEALVDRYDELIGAALSVGQIQNPTVLPLAQYIKKIRRHKG